jgi:hypothetical protein
VSGQFVEDRRGRGGGGHEASNEELETSANPSKMNPGLSRIRGTQNDEHSIQRRTKDPTPWQKPKTNPISPPKTADKKEEDTMGPSRLGQES